MDIEFDFKGDPVGGAITNCEHPTVFFWVLDIDTLERVQRRANKMIPKLRNISYKMRLKECGLTTI